MEDPTTHFPLKEGNILQSESTRYLIICFNGEGRFGKVAQCLNLTTNEVVAIKILKDNNGEKNEYIFSWETEMLTALQSLDPDKENIVRFIDSFRYLNLYCVVFEMLDKSIWDLLYIKRRRVPFTLNEIRPVIHQLIVAFDALKTLNIMHADLKLDNIMLVDQKHQPYKIKLIDFGQALPEGFAQPGMEIQTYAYRAPEVYLGLPLSTAVDMWGVGCIMAQMYFGDTIFPHNCPYNWMKTVIKMRGKPRRWTLSRAIYTDKYFIRDTIGPGWRLRTPAEYQAVNGTAPEDSHTLMDQFKDLERSVKSGQIHEDPIELEDRRAFVNLLQSCLQFDPVYRITPEEALSHTFFTMEHLEDDVGASEYADVALHLMSVCCQSDNSLDNSQPLDNSTSGCNGEDTDAELSNDAPEVDVANPPAATSPNQQDDSGSVSGSPEPSSAADFKRVTSSCSDEDTNAELSNDAPEVNVSNSPAATSSNEQDDSGSVSGSPEPSSAADFNHITSGCSDEDIDAELLDDAPAIDVSNSPATTSSNEQDASGSMSGSPEPSSAADFKPVTSNISAEVEPCSSADAGSTTAGDNVTSAPNEAKKTPLFKRVRKLFARVRKGIVSIFQRPSCTFWPRRWSSKIHPAQDASPAQGRTHTDTW